MRKIDMKNSIKVMTVMLAIGGAFLVGYKSHGEDRLFVESLFLPDYLSSSYSSIMHISKEGPIDRTVSKDEYIEWLEHAVQTVQTEEQLKVKGVQFGTEKVLELIESFLEQSNDPAIKLPPANKDEILQKYAIVVANSLSDIKYNLYGTSINHITRK